MAATKEPRRSPDSPPAPEGADLVELPIGLLQLQRQHAEPGPKPVPLRKQKASGDADAGPPLAPVAAPSPAPRVVHENERVPPGGGLARYKIRCTNCGEVSPVRYVLAASQGDAEAHYLKTTGIGAVALASAGRFTPALTVREQPD